MIVERKALRAQQTELEAAGASSPRRGGRGVALSAPADRTKGCTGIVSGDC